MGQMVEDVRLAVNGIKPVEFFGRVGGNIMTPADIVKLATAGASKSASKSAAAGAAAKTAPIKNAYVKDVSVKNAAEQSATASAHKGGTK
jgi:hypothetical protein